MNKIVKYASVLIVAVMLIAVLPLCSPAQAEPMAALAPAARETKASNWVLNGDFETGDLSNWSSWQGTAASEDAAAGGTYGAHLIGEGGWGGMLRQDVLVEKGTTYVISFWAKVNSVGTNLLFFGASTNTQYTPAEGSSGMWISKNSWTKMTYTVTPTDDTKMAINFSGGGTGKAESIYIDDITMYPEGVQPDEPDLPPSEPLTLFSYGTIINRPVNESKNLIRNGSFETANDAQWSVNTFLSDNVSVVRDETTYDGRQALYFNTSGTTEPEWHIFWVEVEKNTNYTFSAWLKGSFLSADNAGRATIGIIDPNTKKFLTFQEKDQDIAGSMFSNSERQMVPTAWDNRWHLNSVVFNSKEKTTVGVALYGYGSQLWVDGMALFKVGDGKKYTSENMVGVVSPGYDAQFNSCAPEDNVIQNATLEDTGSDFWQTGNGWKNGFLSVAESQYEYGNSLKYTASANPSGVHYIKWLTVEPNTEYTFSADIKILQEGKGALVLVDGKMRDSVSFMTVEFNVGDWGSDWFELCFTFNTDVFTTLGVGVCDMGGEALLDNLRLFKSEDGINAEDDFVAKADGWCSENGKWAYYENGKKVTDKWVKDSAGWCYLGDDGYCVTNKWVADSIGWCYLTESGRMATNKWIKDSVGWCYVGDNGYCVTNKWVKDSIGWCYLDDQGRMATNRWIKDSVGWCYVGDNGYCVTNKWVKDSVGWCYLDENGRMATNRWVRDSKGWCYVGGDGYAVTNCWKKDSKGWCYLDGEGSMTKNDWVSYNGDWYYLDQNGYMVAGKTLTINGTSYTFDKNGVLVA